MFGYLCDIQVPSVVRPVWVGERVPVGVGWWRIVEVVEVLIDGVFLVVIPLAVYCIAINKKSENCDQLNNLKIVTS